MPLCWQTKKEASPIGCQDNENKNFFVCMFGCTEQLWCTEQLFVRKLKLSFHVLLLFVLNIPWTCEQTSEHKKLSFFLTFNELKIKHRTKVLKKKKLVIVNILSDLVHGSNANVKLSEEKCWKQIARGKVENDIGKIHMLEILFEKHL